LVIGDIDGLHPACLRRFMSGRALHDAAPMQKDQRIPMNDSQIDRNIPRIPKMPTRTMSSVTLWVKVPDPGLF
jgi:hypothetical protein